MSRKKNFFFLQNVQKYEEIFTKKSKKYFYNIKVKKKL